VAAFFEPKVCRTRRIKSRISLRSHHRACRLQVIHVERPQRARQNKSPAELGCSDGVEGAQLQRLEPREPADIQSIQPREVSTRQHVAEVQASKLSPQGQTHGQALTAHKSLSIAWYCAAVSTQLVDRKLLHRFDHDVWIMTCQLQSHAVLCYAMRCGCLFLLGYAVALIPAAASEEGQLFMAFTPWLCAP